MKNIILYIVENYINALSGHYDCPDNHQMYSFELIMAKAKTHRIKIGFDSEDVLNVLNAIGYPVPKGTVIHKIVEYRTEKANKFYDRIITDEESMARLEFEVKKSLNAADQNSRLWSEIEDILAEWGEIGNEKRLDYCFDT